MKENRSVVDIGDRASRQSPRHSFLAGHSPFDTASHPRLRNLRNHPETNGTKQKCSPSLGVCKTRLDLTDRKLRHSVSPFLIPMDRKFFRS
ncbi:hypothetical protein C2S52_021277, partial [Perilla frutescens var. hirtella]